MFLLIPFEHSPIRVHHFSLFHSLSHDFLSHRVPSLPTFRGPPHDFLSHRVPDFSHSDDFLLCKSLHRSLFDDFLKSFSSTSHDTAHFLMTSSSPSLPQVTHLSLFLYSLLTNTLMGYILSPESSYPYRVFIRMIHSHSERSLTYVRL